MSEANYHLREIEEKDLDLVLKWRNSPRLRALSNSDKVIEPQSHRRWFKKLKLNSRAKCWIFERGTTPLGLVLFTEINSPQSSCQWGFYLGEENLPPGTGTIMANLALRWVFDERGLKEVRAECLSTNAKGLRFHKQRGFVETKKVSFVAHAAEKKIKVLHLVLTSDDWRRSIKS